MKGDTITARIEKDRDPRADGFNWLREESAKSMLKFVHGIEDPTRTEDAESITLSGVATKDPEEYGEDDHA